jgi:hypothetical protein
VLCGGREPETKVEGRGYGATLTECVLYERTDHVATITYNRTQVLNRHRVTDLQRVWNRAWALASDGYQIGRTVRRACRGNARPPFGIHGRLVPDDRRRMTRQIVGWGGRTLNVVV